MVYPDQAPRFVADVGRLSSPIAPPEHAELNKSKSGFTKLLTKNSFPWELVTANAARVLAGLSFSYDPENSLSHFYDIGTIEQGVPNDEYRIDLGGQMIETRKSRIRGLVPEALEADLAVDWALAHEFGHGVQAAYGLLHEENREEGVFVGLSYYPRPEQVFLDANPKEACHPDPYTARVIEKERQAEGLARLMLLQSLADKGIDHQQAEAIVAKVYETWHAELPKEIEAIPSHYYLVGENHPAQEYGRAHPLSREELLDRFEK